MSYKITYPNSKVDIGQGGHRQINYLDSTDSELIAKNFTRSQRCTFTIKREIPWQSETASHSDVSRKELELIRLYIFTIPSSGYHR